MLTVRIIGNFKVANSLFVKMKLKLRFSVAVPVIAVIPPYEKSLNELIKGQKVIQRFL